LPDNESIILDESQDMKTYGKINIDKGTLDKNYHDISQYYLDVFRIEINR
jgi:hypothetical protein